MIPYLTSLYYNTNSSYTTNSASTSQVISLLVNQKMHDYVIKVIESKLKSLMLLCGVSTNATATGTLTPKSSFFQAQTTQLAPLSQESNNYGSPISSQAASQLVMQAAATSLSTSAQLLAVAQRVGLDQHLVYDPESFDSEQLFSFLSSLWVAFCVRINAPTNQDAFSLFNANVASRYTSNFLRTSCKYISYCHNIWSIVKRLHPNNQDKLLREESKQLFNRHNFNF
jgi:hypothetical protein